jgi:hypothetical protein
MSGIDWVFSLELHGTRATDQESPPKSFMPLPSVRMVVLVYFTSDEVVISTKVDHSPAVDHL